MSFTVVIARDFDHMSDIASRIVVDDLKNVLKERDTYLLGLATGNTPTGLYKRFAAAANAGEFDSGRIVSFNLDEYVGLPGENAQQRVLHPQSYSFFMIQELFSLLDTKFQETSVPWGTVIDQVRLEEELAAHPSDWDEQGTDKGKAIVIAPDAQSSYLRWIRREVLDAYAEKIARAGGIDLHVVGVGGKGHVAFHESGIPFDGNEMLLVKLDENTVENAVTDGHFESADESPLFAISMGSELVYRARKVLLLANGKRKAEPVARSLMEDPSPDIPISYSQLYAQNGGDMTYVIDEEAAVRVIDNISDITARDIRIDDRRKNG